MDARQKLLALGTIGLMNAGVWLFTLLFGGLFVAAVALLFTLLSGGATLRLLAL
jgi:hypothetical protein